jgi:hypothetical protein
MNTEKSAVFSILFKIIDIELNTMFQVIGSSVQWNPKKWFGEDTNVTEVIHINTKSNEI